MSRIIAPEKQQDQRYEVTFTVRVTRPEWEQWQSFLTQYNLEAGALVRRAVRLCLDTIRRYPHTPLVRDLTANKLHTRWDFPLKDLDL